MDRSRKQHTNVSHDLELLTNMELEAENSEFDSVSNYNIVASYPIWR